MKPVTFKEANVNFAESQDQYETLPAFKDNDGVVISCWKMSFIERLRILFHGKVWMSLMTFNKPLTPSYLASKKSEVLTTQ